MGQAARATDRWTVRDYTPLGRAYYNGKLAIGGRQYTAEDRYDAGRRYREIWDTIHSTGSRESFPERVNCSRRGGGDQEPKAIARDLLKRLEGQLSAHARYILRQFLGEGGSASAAVSERLSGFEKSTWVAICLYLDELCDALVRIDAQC